MALQLLTQAIQTWSPSPPEVKDRTKCSVTLSWSPGPFGFIQEQLVYTVQRREKVPAWVNVYSGGKTVKTIDNLAPSHPHKFRLKVSLKPTHKHVDENVLQNIESLPVKGDWPIACNEVNGIRTKDSENGKCSKVPKQAGPISSLWSEETWTSTDSAGTSATCFCMAVRCGYVKQVQQMLEERPILISAINSSNGFTPLATAVRKGDINTVKLLLSFGADINQRSTSSQTPLHLAVLGANVPVVELLLERGADKELRDINELRMEHYAVDSANLDVLKFVLSHGDVTVRDNNGWTPLFRAVCQGSKTELIEELVKQGSSVEVTDRAGLTLIAAARVLKDRHGRRRESVLKLVDIQFQHEKALANFTRLTKKISSVQTLLHFK
ncbi:ankyrin-2 [Colias croceus]|uniref:ankyrin-2 n=1 Tax=Colias crocea TaxID=72248 RepID=UPI001E27D163|nr:ankyrin-2 [Colias croceus]